MVCGAAGSRRCSPAEATSTTRAAASIAMTNGAGAAKSALGATTMIWLALTTMAGREVRVPFDHVATVRVLCGEPECSRSRFVPVMVRVRSALPAATVSGEIELMAIDAVGGGGVAVGDAAACCGGTFEAPPAQPENVATIKIRADRIVPERSILPRLHELPRVPT